MEKCNLQDFLPFKCEGCKQVFCLNHRATNKHDCPRADFGDNKVFKCPICLKMIRIVPDEDINITWASHSSKDCDPSRRDRERKKRLVKRKDRCKLIGCKAKLNAVTRMHCQVCNLDFCVKHRLPSNHECGTRKMKKKNGVTKVSSSRTIATTTTTRISETCPQCGAQFPSAESLVVHFQHAHEKKSTISQHKRKKSCVIS